MERLRVGNSFEVSHNARYSKKRAHGWSIGAIHLAHIRFSPSWMNGSMLPLSGDLNAKEVTIKKTQVYDFKSDMWKALLVSMSTIQVDVVFLGKLMCIVPASRYIQIQHMINILPSNFSFTFYRIALLWYAIWVTCFSSISSFLTRSITKCI